MSTVQDAPAADPGLAASGGQPYRFAAEAFFRMIAADVFADDERVELWDGRITTKMAKKIAHSAAAARINYALIRSLPAGWLVWPENPVRISPNQVPLPDFAVVRGGLDAYTRQYPTAGDVGLIVEISDSSLRYDPTTKLAGYAEAGVPAYWVVDLVHNVVLAHAGPAPAERRYAREATYAVGQVIPLHLDGALVAEIPAADLLPSQA